VFLRPTLRTIAALALSLGALVACRAESRPAAEDAPAAAAAVAVPTGVTETTTRDGFGAPVSLPATAPRRIVSVGPALTEVLFALGVGDRLVGRSRWDTHPAAALRVPEVGDAIRPNLEAILAARPDLVVLYAAVDNRAAAEALRSAGVPVLALRTDRIHEFARDTRLLGRVLGDTVRAALLVDSVQRTLDRVRAATSAAIAAGAPRPRVLWPLLGEPLFVIGGGSFLSDLVEIAGGTNVFADRPQPAPQVSREEILRRGADVALVGRRGAERLRREPAWRGLQAVRDGRILVYDTALVLRPSVQLGQAAVMLAELLHPGALRPGAQRPDTAR
jgi:ABC-type Fe3+-hydroxamate transport system substrate-binding protein